MVPAFRACLPPEMIRQAPIDYPHTPPNARALHEIPWPDRPYHGKTIRTGDREVIESAILSSSDTSPSVALIPATTSFGVSAPVDPDLDPLGHA
jgi:hypothetical protein